MTGRLAMLRPFHRQVSGKEPAVLQSPSRVQPVPVDGEAKTSLLAEVLTSPTPGTPFLLYIVATKGAVSAVLVEERARYGKKEQTPVYYVSEALAGAKLCYIKLEKMVYAIMMTSRKLKHNFTAHPITIPTLYSLRDVFENREAIGRIDK